MWKFILQEWKLWLSSPMTWIFLLINTLLIMGAVSSDQIQIGGGVGSVHKNAPFVIQTYYGVMSLVCLLMTTAFMNATAIRDFDKGMYQFIFTSPIKKYHYYFGKFIGAYTIAIIPLLGVSLGALLGPYMPWAQAERFGPVFWGGHLQGIFSFAIPNTFIAAVIVFVLAIQMRNNIVSFIGSMLLIVLYSVASGYLRDIEKEWLATFLDPFGFRPLSIISKYFTVDEKNAHAVTLEGALLINRILWISLATIGLIAAYFKFSFHFKKENTSKMKKAEIVFGEIPINAPKNLPAPQSQFTINSILHLIRFETFAIIKNPTFIILLGIGAINLIASLTSFTGRYGVDQYPVTYEVIDTIRGSFYLFLIGIIVFYSGYTVWKDRDSGIHEIQDATPTKNSVFLISKLVALILAVGIVLLVAILIGITSQSLMGYTRFQLDVYFKSLLIMDWISFTFTIVLAFLFHYLINNRYIAYFAVVVFLICNIFLWSTLQISTNMVKYGSTPNVTYSDMNGFGPFIPSTFWFYLYWTLGAIILLFITYAFYIRGKEYQFTHRVQSATRLLKQKKYGFGLTILAFLFCGGFVYHNTKQINTYDSEKEAEKRMIDYENKYKKYEGLTQPRFYKYEYNIDIFPESRSVQANVIAWVKNISREKIGSIHFTLPTIPDTLQLEIPGGKLISDDTWSHYRIYALKDSLLPDDSLCIKLYSARFTKGFENEVSFTQLTQNGTFFNNQDFVPMIGYQEGNELSDKNKRVKYQLPKKRRMPALNEKDLKTRMNNYIRNDADWVTVSTVISTSSDQIAIAPGSLVNKRSENGRNYFTYQLDHSALDFYSFISARYEVARKKWNNIDLEVYYKKEHSYNVPNMLKSMEKSLEYYTKNFGPYYHKQCRIIEFPRYSSFAQAFPGTMPYSEGIGFIIDQRDVTKDDIDEVFYVVAHEMGHQYWAHQLCGAQMQGSEWMSEGFAQYSALMVMEKEYGKDKMKKFLKYEMDGYLRGRSGEFEAERPIMKTEHQQYIHYQKASVLMYYLKEMIGEEKVNLALRSLLDTFAYENPPYPTSLSAVRAFQQVTPDSLQYLISDLFENITLFSNRVLKASMVQKGNSYEVTFHTSSEKFRSDSLGKETWIPISDYINIGVFGKSVKKGATGKPLVMQRVKIHQKENTFIYTVNEKPDQVGIDPYNYLIDRIPSDNLKGVELE